MNQPRDEIGYRMVDLFHAGKQLTHDVSLGILALAILPWVVLIQLVVLETDVLTGGGRGFIILATVAIPAVAFLFYLVRFRMAMSRARHHSYSAAEATRTLAKLEDAIRSDPSFHELLHHLRGNADDEQAQPLSLVQLYDLHISEHPELRAAFEEQLPQILRPEQDDARR